MTDTLIAFAPHTLAASTAIAIWIRSGSFHETFGVLRPTWRNTALVVGAYVLTLGGISVGAFDWLLDIAR